MEKILRLWYFDALVPYSISGDTFSFMGPLPRFVKKWNSSDRFFPSYCEWEPVVFNDQPFGFHFLENQVYLTPPLEALGSEYINWLNRLEKKKKALWKYLGIFDFAQLSWVHLKYNPTMLLTTSGFLESTTNNFHLPYGMLTPTLFHLSAIVGLRSIRETYAPPGLQGPFLLLIFLTGIFTF